MLTSAMTCSVSCAPRYQFVKQDIPIALLAPCDDPQLTGSTYGDVVKLAYRQKIALAECSARIASIATLTENKNDK